MVTILNEERKPLLGNFIFLFDLKLKSKTWSFTCTSFIFVSLTSVELILIYTGMRKTGLLRFHYSRL